MAAVILFVASSAAASAAPKMTAAEVAASNERTLAGLLAPSAAASAGVAVWDTIVFHHSATGGGSKARFDEGHRRKFSDPDGMEYHFLIGNGVGSPDGLIEVGEHWRKQVMAYHLFTRARDPRSVAICLVGNFELPDHVPTKAQMRAATALARALVARFRMGKGAATTHHGIDGRLTQCPGKHFPIAALTAAIDAT